MQQSAKNERKEISLKYPQLLFDDFNSGIEALRAYFSHFGKIPSTKALVKISVKRFLSWFDENFKQHILKRYSHETWLKSNKMIVNSIVYLLKNNMLLEVDSNGDLHLLYQPEDERKAQGMIEQFLLLRKKKKKRHEVSIVMNSEHGIQLHDIKSNAPKMMFTNHYNDSLVELHPQILKQLKSKDSGLILLHGTPGTGKTTYIRYLISLLKKRVIFLPPKLAGNLDSPELSKLLIDNPNSLLIIEDAENLLLSRENSQESNISTLLNLTDGILGKCLNVQMICTFNTHLSNIDKALLRKGRLKFIYRFDALAEDKATALMKELGMKDVDVNSAMTLADIYHAQSTTNVFEDGMKKPIGFLTPSNNGAAL